MRDNSGKFIAGHSGNPGGRPKDEFKVAELACSYTVEAVETLVDLMGHSRRTIGCVKRPLRRSQTGAGARLRWEVANQLADKVISKRYRRLLR